MSSICKSCGAGVGVIVCEFCGTQNGSISSVVDEVQAVDDFLKALSRIGQEQGMSGVAGVFQLGEKSTRLRDAILSCWVPQQNPLTGPTHDRYSVRPGRTVSGSTAAALLAGVPREVCWLEHGREGLRSPVRPVGVSPQRCHVCLK
jgi:hypothetical protein